MGRAVDSRQALLSKTLQTANESSGNSWVQESEHAKAVQDLALGEERRKSLESDRELKEQIKVSVLKIVCLSMWFTIVLIGINTLFLAYGKTLYSEIFLGVLLGSQLLILPFSLLYVITKHLFPFKGDSK